MGAKRLIKPAFFELCPGCVNNPHKHGFIVMPDGSRRGPYYIRENLAEEMAVLAANGAITPEEKRFIEEEALRLGLVSLAAIPKAQREPLSQQDKLFRQTRDSAQQDARHVLVVSNLPREALEKIFGGTVTEEPPPEKQTIH